MPDTPELPSSNAYPVAPYKKAEPIPMWIGDRQVYLLFTLKRVKAVKVKMGRPMMGLKTNILELDEELLPQVLLEGLCDEHGNDLVPPVTMDDFEALPASAYPHLMESFNHAWNGMMPEKKRKKLLELEEAARAEANPEPALVSSTSTS